MKKLAVILVVLLAVAGCHMGSEAYMEGTAPAYIEYLESRAATYEKRARGTVDRIAEMQERIQHLKAQKANDKEKLAAVNDRINELQAKRRSADTGAEVEAMDYLITRMKDQRQGLEADIGRLEEIIGGVKDNIARQRNYRQDLERRAAVARSKAASID
jgi:predicted  nucleic acid-binding Zn-ribbon protein